MTHPKYQRRSRRTRPSSPIRLAQTFSHVYARDRRSEFFSALNRLSLVRRHGPAPFDWDVRYMDEAIVRAANAHAMIAKVLP